MRVLVVEGDKRLATTMKRGLEHEGFAVDVAFDGAQGKRLATEQRYDAIVLDTRRPALNSDQLCRDMRHAGDWTPILMLSAKQGEFGEAEALHNGADVHLAYPFSFAALLARLTTMMRHKGPERPTMIEIADLRLDPARHRCWRGVREVRLTDREFEVLEYLARRAGEVIARRELLDRVWDLDFRGDPNIVDVYVARIRRKIDGRADSAMIHTIRGAGYRLSDAA